MRFSWSVENGSRDCPVGSDRQPRAPRNGLRGSRYRPRQRLSALGGNEHKIKPRVNQETCSVASTADTMLENMDYYILRKIARHIGNSSIACRTGDCPASCRKIQRQPQESRDLIGCLPTLTPIIHPTSGGLTLCELIKRYKEDPSRRSLTDKTRDT